MENLGITILFFVVGIYGFYLLVKSQRGSWAEYFGVVLFAIGITIGLLLLVTNPIERFPEKEYVLPIHHIEEKSFINIRNEYVDTVIISNETQWYLRDSARVKFDGYRSINKTYYNFDITLLKNKGGN